MFDSYYAYIGARGLTKRDRNIAHNRADLQRLGVDSPDYQPDALRNGEPQPMIFTRAGEEHMYNVICMPGDDLYAGDLIDCFGEHWIVMEARADATTHKTGKMLQCNKLFRFQNFDGVSHEVWGAIKASGYSSTVTGTNQMQKSEEQFAIYLPYNDVTDKLYVDKRIASHRGWDKSGRPILNAFKITSAVPNARSYNSADHLLVLKCLRDVYSEFKDNLELEICDYMAPGTTPDADPEALTPDIAPVVGMHCEILGRPNVLLNRARTLTAVFYKEDGVTVDDTVTPVWTYDELEGLTVTVDGNKLVIQASDLDELIGADMVVTLKDSDGRYEQVSVDVEVRNIA